MTGLRSLMAVFFLLILFAAGTTPSIAQDSLQEGKTISLSSGLNGYFVRDRQVSALMYDGNPIPIYLDFEKITPRAFWNISGSYLYGELKNKYGNSRETMAGHFRVSYQFQTKLLSNQKFTKLFAGPWIGFTTSVENNSFPALEREITLITTGYLTGALGFVTTLKNRPFNNRDLFIIQPAVSVVGIVLRPGYGLYYPESFGDAVSKAGISSYGKFLSGSLKLAFRKGLTSQMYLEISLRSSYIRYSEPLETRSFNQAALAGFGVML